MSITPKERARRKAIRQRARDWQPKGNPNRKLEGAELAEAREIIDALLSILPPKRRGTKSRRKPQ